MSPQWHRWLHYQTDEVPSAKELEYRFRTPHHPNLTGTSLAYRPSGYLFQKNVKVSHANGFSKCVLFILFAQSFQNYQRVEDPLTAERLNEELAKSAKD